MCGTIILAVNYLSGQTWLPLGNLAFVIGVLHCVGGTVGHALDFGLVEGLTVCALVTVPLGGYALASAELSDETFRIAFPLVVFATSALLMHATLFDEVSKGGLGSLVYIALFIPRALCKTSGGCEPFFLLRLDCGVAALLVRVRRRRSRALVLAVLLAVVAPDHQMLPRVLQLHRPANAQHTLTSATPNIDIICC